MTPKLRAMVDTGGGRQGAALNVVDECCRDRGVSHARPGGVVAIFAPRDILVAAGGP